MYKTVSGSNSSDKQYELWQFSDYVKYTCKVPKWSVQNWKRTFAYKVIIVYTLSELKYYWVGKDKNWVTTTIIFTVSKWYKKHKELHTQGTHCLYILLVSGSEKWLSSKSDDQILFLKSYADLEAINHLKEACKASKWFIENCRRNFAHKIPPYWIFLCGKNDLARNVKKVTVKNILS